MRFYVNYDTAILANFSFNLPWILRVAEEADKLGFDGILMPDLYLWPKENRTLDPWITLSYLAAKTERIRLGTMVTPIPFRPPAILAKMITTLDILSGGRTALGVGAGWHKESFEAYSEWDPSNRVRVDKTREGIKLMIRLWTEEGPVTFQGKYYSVKNAVLQPKPIQKPHPLLIFGGAGDRMLRLAGTYANICYFSHEFPTLKDVKKGMDKVLNVARKVNRAEKISFARSIVVGDDFEKRVKEAAEAGVGNFFLIFRTPDRCIEMMRDVAERVISSFR